MTSIETDVLIIGAGPIGIELAVALKRAGVLHVQLDAGQIGSTIHWYAPQTHFFSSPERIAISGVPLQTLDQTKATREEYLTYLRTVVLQFDLEIQTYERVTSLIHRPDGLFDVTSRRQDGERRWLARSVIVAIGDMHRPHLLDIPGEDLPHVSHYYKEPYQHATRNVVVVGAKNSSAKAALQLTRAGAKVTLLVRGPAISDSVKYWIRPDLVNRIAEGRITAHFNTTITAITPAAVEVLTPEGPLRIPTDFVYALTGYHPDEALLGRLGVDPDPADEARAPLFDPATHETTRPGVFVAGTVCGGRATSRWFIENGRHHAQLIAAYLAGGVFVG